MKAPQADVCLIGRVADEFGALSNMSAHPLNYEGLLWPRAEHLFQALRFAPTHPARECIRAEKNPMRAKMLAKTLLGEAVVVPRSLPDLKNMQLVVRLKHEQHESVRKLLVSTGERRIIEDYSRRPTDSGLFWGAMWGVLGPPGSPPQWVGSNWLGRLWMERRDGRLT